MYLKTRWRGFASKDKEQKRYGYCKYQVPHPGGRRHPAHVGCTWVPPASASEAGSQGCGALCEDTKRLGSVSVGLFWPVMAVLTASWGASTTSLATWALARRETPHRRCAGHSGQCLAFARCAEHRSHACAL